MYCNRCSKRLTRRTTEPAERLRIKSIASPINWYLRIKSVIHQLLNKYWLVYQYGSTSYDERSIGTISIVRYCKYSIVPISIVRYCKRYWLVQRLRYCHRWCLQYSLRSTIYDTINRLRIKSIASPINWSPLYSTSATNRVSWTISIVRYCKQLQQHRCCRNDLHHVQQALQVQYRTVLQLLQVGIVP